MPLPKFIIATWKSDNSTLKNRKEKPVEQPTFHTNTPRHSRYSSTKPAPDHLQISATATLNIVRQSPQRASSYKRAHGVKRKRNKIQQERTAAAEQAAEEERMQQLEAEEKCIETARKERQLHMELEKQRFTG
jgi:hypothetical protein